MYNTCLFLLTGNIILIMWLLLRVYHQQHPTPCLCKEKNPGPKSVIEQCDVRRHTIAMRSPPTTVSTNRKTITRQRRRRESLDVFHVAGTRDTRVTTRTGEHGPHSGGLSVESRTRFGGKEDERVNEIQTVKTTRPSVATSGWAAHISRKKGVKDVGKYNSNHSVPKRRSWFLDPGRDKVRDKKKSRLPSSVVEVLEIPEEAGLFLSVAGRILVQDASHTCWARRTCAKLRRLRRWRTTRVANAHTECTPEERARWLLVSAGRSRAFHVVVGGLCIVITGGGRYLRRGGSVTDAHTPRCSHVRDDGGGGTVQSAARVPYRVDWRPDHHGRRVVLAAGRVKKKTHSTVTDY